MRRALARCDNRPSRTKQLSWHDAFDCRRLSYTPLNTLTSVRSPKRLHKLHIPSESCILFCSVYYSSSSTARVWRIIFASFQAFFFNGHPPGTLAAPTAAAAAAAAAPLYHCCSANADSEVLRNPLTVKRLAVKRTRCCLLLLLCDVAAVLLLIRFADIGGAHTLRTLASPSIMSAGCVQFSLSTINGLSYAMYEIQGIAVEIVFRFVIYLHACHALLHPFTLQQHQHQHQRQWRCLVLRRSQSSFLRHPLIPMYRV